MSSARIRWAPRATSIWPMVDLPHATPPVRPTFNMLSGLYLRAARSSQEKYKRRESHTYYRLATSDLRRILHAFSRFTSNMATVSGPTPPGTGVEGPRANAAPRRDAAIRGGAFSADYFSPF